MYSCDSFSLSQTPVHNKRPLQWKLFWPYRYSVWSDWQAELQISFLMLYVVEFERYSWALMIKKFFGVLPIPNFIALLWILLFIWVLELMPETKTANDHLWTCFSDATKHFTLRTKDHNCELIKQNFVKWQSLLFYNKVKIYIQGTNHI